MINNLAKCHTGNMNHSGCRFTYGPGILPVWASDLLAWAVVLLIAGAVVAVYIYSKRRFK